jgi:hypothetical protein
MRSLSGRRASLDKIFFQADTFVMFRKCLALLLGLSWLILTGSVISEDVDGSRAQFHRSAHAPRSSAKPVAVLTDDTVEAPSPTQLSQCEWVEAATAELATIGLTSLQRHFKLHKVHHVFLI